MSSAGLSAIDGEKISKNSALALKKIGLKSYSFRSKQLTNDILKKTDIIICMTASHKAMLSGVPNVVTMAEISGQGDILDPYGGDINVYTTTMYQIDDGCSIILEKIINQKGE